MKRLYLGRVSSAFYDKYELGRVKDEWSLSGGFPFPITHFCPEIFEQFTNIKLKPGEIRKVESIKFKLVPVKRGKK